MVTEPPEISLATCEAGTVDARLLASADSNNRPVEGVGDTVRLCVLERQCGHNKIRYSTG